MREWSRLARSGRFQLDAWSGGIDPEDSLRAVQTQVLALGVHGDLLAPPEAIGALLEKVPRAAVERGVITTNAAPGRAPHVAWAREPDEAAERVCAWLHAPRV
jgi:predicted alpha/beta hydrolase